MKVADWAVRAVVIATFFALLIAPEKWGFPLGLIALGIVGTWALYTRKAFLAGPRRPTRVSMLMTVPSGGYRA
jgi:hypothetical protein